MARDTSCNCLPSRENPSVIGACGCPEHGMKALISERDGLRRRLAEAVEALHAAPMPERESILKDEEWRERYGEWWHKHASNTALIKLERGS
jgi:hypothetical protein